MCVVDYNTVACTDKFGNVFVLRLPENCNDDVAESSGGSRLLWDQGLLNGAPNKLELLTHYYLGETATSITKCALKLQGREVLLVSTITGGVFAFVPSKSKEEASFFQHLEMFMRQEYTNLCQRDHLAYRSYFSPVKQTVDGDLCERYATLLYVKQKEFGDDVDRSPAEVIKKLEELRDFV
jgi:splicing factor 3B subunit 3